jgi:hypothetical protein
MISKSQIVMMRGGELREKVTEFIRFCGLI